MSERRHDNVGSVPLAVASASDPNAPGARLFEHRRRIHPVFVMGSILIGDDETPSRMAGIVLIVVNLALRMWAGRHLGGAARVHARKAQVRKVLVTTGPYAWVRNPLYLANALGLAGACLLFGPAWFAAAAALVALIWYRAIIDWEELVNLRLYGDAYRAYLARVPRLLPRLPRRSGPSRSPAASLAPTPSPAARAALTPAVHPWLKVLRRERGAFFNALGVIALSLLLDRFGH